MNFEKKMEERTNSLMADLTIFRRAEWVATAAQRGCLAGCFDRVSFMQLILDNNYGLPGDIAHSILLPSVLIALWLRLPM